MDADAAFAEYDELNARRIAANEYETFKSLFNVSSSTPLAFSPTTTYSLVDITAVHTVTSTTAVRTNSTAKAAVAAAVAEASPAVTSGTSASLAEWTKLNRNIYVIIGLLSGALVLGLLCLALVIKDCANGRNRMQVAPPVPFREPERTPLTMAFHDSKS